MPINRIVNTVVLVAGPLLFVDLFLDWRQTTVSLPLVDISAGSSGWNGWGVAAGIAAAALVVQTLLRLLDRPTLRCVGVSALLATLVGGFTLGAFTSGADVSVGSVGVTVAGHHWPAWVGLVLAGTLFAATLWRLVDALAHTPRMRAGTA